MCVYRQRFFFCFGKHFVFGPSLSRNIAQTNYLPRLSRFSGSDLEFLPSKPNPLEVLQFVKYLPSHREIIASDHCFPSWARHQTDVNTALRTRASRLLTTCHRIRSDDSGCNMNDIETIAASVFHSARDGRLKRLQVSTMNP